jgi:hypothetical protein
MSARCNPGGDTALLLLPWTRLIGLCIVVDGDELNGSRLDDKIQPSQIPTGGAN